MSLSGIAGHGEAALQSRYEGALTQVGIHPPHWVCPTTVKHSFLPRLTISTTVVAVI